MPTDHDMPAAWQAQAARNRSPEIAAAIAVRARQQRAATPQASASGTPHPPTSQALDELSRRRVARFAALEARRLTTGPPRPPQPPVAS